MYEYTSIPELSTPRFLNDPDEFLVGVTTDVTIFSDGFNDYAVPAGQEVFVNTQELEGRYTNTLRVYLGRNYRFTATVDVRAIEPA